ncbi:Usher syndrome 3A homolog (human) [Rattus norvegicus]|uniref:Usher syndrome 3A homolog (Human) n=1 Tax=Rattus norvegicus TaxID=10116 RepID=A6JVJ5_RAT|nr:Usher syndrome 3A homolog (human) [Rattus norvegicus]
MLTKVFVLNFAFTEAFSHHAKPAEEDHLLHGWRIELSLCSRSGDRSGNPTVGESHYPLQNRGSACQCVREGAGQVHGRDAVWSFPRRRRKAMRVRSKAFPVLIKVGEEEVLCLSEVKEGKQSSQIWFKPSL